MEKIRCPYFLDYRSYKESMAYWWFRPEMPQDKLLGRNKMAIDSPNGLLSIQRILYFPKLTKLKKIKCLYFYFFSLVAKPGYCWCGFMIFWTEDMTERNIQQFWNVLIKEDLMTPILHIRMTKTNGWPTKGRSFDI